MKKFGLLAAACGAAAFGLATAASAVPLGQPAIGSAEADAGIVQLIHGCHPNWREDRYGLHRHGRSCRRIQAEAEYEPPRIYIPQRRCYYVGPLRVCE